MLAVPTSCSRKLARLRKANWKVLNAEYKMPEKGKMATRESGTERATMTSCLEWDGQGGNKIKIESPEQREQ